MNYDVVVIGAGHAGVEASLASAKLGLKTALVNFYKDKVATMPCNPSIGGPAKGIVVREIDALGGQMAKSADKNAIQMKLLNSSRGPGVWALRAQIDKIKYSKYMLNIIQKQKNIDFIVDGFLDADVNHSQITSVSLESGRVLETKALIITAGTYSNSSILVGSDFKKEGPNGEKTSCYLLDFLDKMGLKHFRFKTGTPPRVIRETVDLSKAVLEPGTKEFLSFSFSTKKNKNYESQEDCYLIHSTKKTKKIIEENLKKSAIYSGKEIGVGPRYCPSFEDKIVRFNKKDTHQIFLEPESKSLNTLYVQGFSTSMPIDVQEKMLKSLPGFEKVVVDKWAYAIEYDCIDPMQLSLTLATKKIPNLFFAGQINGTSGYEEAAAQGLVAGINAAMLVLNKKPLILKRNQAYIGVMIDDLVNKGVDEPYRLLTSRAEYRLSLRNDNAERRLKHIGKEIGLVGQEEWNFYEKSIIEINDSIEFLKKTKIKPKDNFSKFLLKENDINIMSSISLYDLLKQSRLNHKLIFDNFQNLKKLTPNQLNDILINCRFEGYIKKEQELILKMSNQEKKMIPKDINYDDVENIASEARTYLKKVMPTSIGQASRVRGVNPSDIQMLLFYMKNKYSSNSK